MKRTRSSRLANSYTISRLRLRTAVPQCSSNGLQDIVGKIGFVMPRGIVFGSRNAFAFDGVADDNPRSLRGRAHGGAQHLAQLRDVMSIAFRYVKPEARPLVGQWLHVLNLEHATCRLNLIVVDQHGEIAEPVLVGTSSRFPIRALVRLAVAY